MNKFNIGDKVIIAGYPICFDQSPYNVEKGSMHSIEDIRQPKGEVAAYYIKGYLFEEGNLIPYKDYNSISGVAVSRFIPGGRPINSKPQVKDIWWINPNEHDYFYTPNILLKGLFPPVGRYEIYDDGSWSFQCHWDGWGGEELVGEFKFTEEWIEKAKQICQQHAQSILEGLIK